ncbi:hypothetical protein GCM10022403_008000 [Streptomyces coacervatus]|uniref:Uncharacterized protein n=1 Tax=Streptomyces coacervatus TaxID=647381 RepID=A0ABP7GVP7_9ACTN
MRRQDAACQATEVPLVLTYVPGDGTRASRIQRITLENQQLREELEAATGGTRGAGDPGYGALRVAAQGSIESLEDAFATASGCGWQNRRRHGVRALHTGGP